MEIPLIFHEIKDASGINSSDLRFSQTFIVNDVTSRPLSWISSRLREETDLDKLRLLQEIRNLILEELEWSRLHLQLVQMNKGCRFNQHFSIVVTHELDDEKPPCLLQRFRDAFGRQFGLKVQFCYPDPLLLEMMWFSTEQEPVGFIPDAKGRVHAKLTFQESKSYPGLDSSNVDFVQGSLRIWLHFRSGRAPKRKLSEQCAINEKMLKMELATDAVIVCGTGKEFKCHKSFLFAHSPVLQVMFSSGMEESRTSRIEVTDLSEKVVEAFLHYLYTKDTSEVAGDWDLTFGLLYAAHKYEVKCLEQRAIELLQEMKNQNVPVEFALKLFMFLGSVPGAEAQRLKKKAAAVMKFKFDALALLPEYDELFQKNPAGAKELIKYFADD